MEPKKMTRTSEEIGDCTPAAGVCSLNEQRREQVERLLHVLSRADPDEDASNLQMRRDSGSLSESLQVAHRSSPRLLKSSGDVFGIKIGVL